MSTTVQHCRSCGAPVFWLRHSATGKLAPIDVEPVEGGNVLIDTIAGAYQVLHGARADASSVQDRVHTNHFQTCPQAPAWRQRGSRKP